MSQQLVKKGVNGKHENVMPRSWIEAIKDKNTGQTLVEILQGFNMYFLPYNGNTPSTRCLVPTMLRKKGLWITYVKYDGNVYTEWYAADELDDKSWGDSSNWRIGNNTLVGDITISANGNWVINGTETEFKAVGEKGNTPLLRVANNRLQVSYNLGASYIDVTTNPVYTKFRWLATTGDTQANNVGRIQASTDEGKTWTNMSNDFTNNLHIKKYIGVNESLPTSGIAEGTIYAKGPYYAEDDALNDNPIYRLWVYAWKGNTLAWQDNGEFTSIAAGIVQELGNNENAVPSQKLVTEKLSELGSNPSLFKYINITENVNNLGYVYKDGSLLFREDGTFYLSNPIKVIKGQLIVVNAPKYENLSLISSYPSSDFIDGVKAKPLVLAENEGISSFLVDSDGYIIISFVKEEESYAYICNNVLIDIVSNLTNSIDSISKNPAIFDVKDITSLVSINGYVYKSGEVLTYNEDSVVGLRSEPIAVKKGQLIIVNTDNSDNFSPIASYHSAIIDSKRAVPLVYGSDDSPFAFIAQEDGFIIVSFWGKENNSAYICENAVLKEILELIEELGINVKELQDIVNNEIPLITNDLKRINNLFYDVWVQNPENEDLSTLDNNYISGITRRQGFQGIIDAKLYGFVGDELLSLSLLSKDYAGSFILRVSKKNNTNWETCLEVNVPKEQAFNINDRYINIVAYEVNKKENGTLEYEDNYDETNRRRYGIFTIDLNNVVNRAILSQTQPENGPELVISKRCFMNTPSSRVKTAIEESKYKSNIEHFDTYKISLPVLVHENDTPTIIKINNQEEFDNLHSTINEEIRKGKTNIKVIFNAKTVFCGRTEQVWAITEQDELNDWSSVSISLIGNGCTVIAGRENIVYSTEDGEVSNYGYKYKCEGFEFGVDSIDSNSRRHNFIGELYHSKNPAIQIDSKTWKIDTDCENLKEEDCSDFYISVFQGFKVLVHKVIKVEDGYIYINSDSVLEPVYNNTSINADYNWSSNYGVRYKYINKPYKDLFIKGTDLYIPYSYGDTHLLRKGGLLFAKDKTIKHLSIEGFNFMGGTSSLIYCNDTIFSNYCEIKNNTFIGGFEDIIKLNNGSNYIISNNIFTESYRKCIHASGVNNIYIYNNRFNDNGLFGNNDGVIYCRCKNYYIFKNAIINSCHNDIFVGYAGTSEDWSNTFGIIEYNTCEKTQNFIENYLGKVGGDNGSIYVSTKNEQVIIRHNLIVNNIGRHITNGIYLDEGAFNVAIYKNMVLNNANGKDIISWMRSLTAEPQYNTDKLNTNNFLCYNILTGYYHFVGQYETKDTNSCIKGRNILLYDDFRKDVNNIINYLQGYEKDYILTKCKIINGKIYLPNEYKKFINTIGISEYVMERIVFNL